MDPAKVPEGGVYARCSVCAGVFFVDRPEKEQAPLGAARASAASPPPDAPAPAAGAPARPDGPGSGAGLSRAAAALETPRPVEIPAEPAAPAALPERGAPRVFEIVESSAEAPPALPPLETTPAGAPPEPRPAPVPPSPAAASHVEAPRPPAVPEPPPAAPETASAAPRGDMSAPAQPAAAASTPAAPAPTFAFGRRDPHEKARRLARVLVSDMIMYNPERHSRAIAGGSLRVDFEDEIKKSWQEYVDQVGDEIAKGTSYFDDALNDILARGERIFP